MPIEKNSLTIKRIGLKTVYLTLTFNGWKLASGVEFHFYSGHECAFDTFVERPRTLLVGDGMLLQG